MDRVKSKFRRFSNKPSLVHESKIREWDGTLIFKSRVSSSDTQNLAKAFKDSAELLSLDVRIPILNHKEEQKKDMEDIRELLKKRKEDDLKKIKGYIRR